MAYPEAAWERAMTVQEVMLKALSGELHWFRAADILGWSPRTLRRWRERYETHGHSGLDRQAAAAPVEAPGAAAAGRAGAAAVSGAVRGLQCAALSSDCAARARRHRVLQLREADAAGGAAW